MFRLAREHIKLGAVAFVALASVCERTEGQVRGPNQTHADTCRHLRAETSTRPHAPRARTPHHTHTHTHTTNTQHIHTHRHARGRSAVLACVLAEEDVFGLEVRVHETDVMAEGDRDQHLESEAAHVLQPAYAYACACMHACKYTIHARRITGAQEGVWKAKRRESGDAH